MDKRKYTTTAAGVCARKTPAAPGPLFLTNAPLMQPLSAEDFLDRMQQLILGTSMNSTYKLALLMSVTDAALAFAPTGLNEETCRIPLSRVALEFLRIYWPQRLPFSSGLPGVAPARLSQGINRRAGAKSSDAVFTIIDEALEEAHRLHPEAGIVTFEQFSRCGGLLQKAARRCTALLKKNPLKYIAPEADFLFEQKGDALELAAFSVHLLQRFRPIINELVESRWVAHLRGIESNDSILGQAPGASLRDFLFNPVRGDTLAGIRRALVEITGARCFYCGKKIARHDALHVDHFLPFTRYAHTRLFNFVLACPSCNASKSNWLAGARHVEHWVERNADYAAPILEASADFAPAGGLEVANMALSLYGLAAGHAEPLWLERSKPRQALYENILPALQENRTTMLALGASA